VCGRAPVYAITSRRHVPPQIIPAVSLLHHHGRRRAR
jgi:hypothetical protein